MMLNRRDQIVRIVNIADSPKEIADSALSHGKLIVESMKAVYLPMEVFIRVRGRYSDWMRNTAQENNADRKSVV